MAVRVLIVDDHAPFRALARMLLVLDGFDVVLLDVQLPDEDGFAVAGTLAAHRPAPAVVLVSSRSRSDYGHRVTASAAHGFIAKAELSGAALRLVLGEETRAS